MYSSFSNSGNSVQQPQQSFYSGNVAGAGFQQPPLQLRQSNTTTEFGDFVSSTQPSYGNPVSLQQQGTGYGQQPLQQQGTGFGQQPLQQQGTGFGQQPLQQQGTGFGQPPNTSFGSFQQSFNQQLNPQNTGTSLMPQTSFGAQIQQPLLPQQTGFYNQQQPATGYLKPTATGYVNSMAQNSNYNNQLVLPNLRLSFVTIDDQKKFEKLFRSKVPAGSNTISGLNCREILTRSGLPPKQLAQIWNLADTLRAGELMFPEFVLAMYLINSVLQGESLPFALENKIRVEVTKFVDAINFQVGEVDESSNNQNQQPLSHPTPFDNLTSGIQLQPQLTSMIPPTSFGDFGQFNNQNLVSQNTGAMPSNSFATQIQQTTGSTQNQWNSGIPNQSTGFNQNQWNNGLQPQMTGSQAPQTSFGNFNNENTNALRANQTGMGLIAQPTGILPPSNFQPTVPLQAQRTGFGNNDLYSQSNFVSKFTAENEDYVTSEEKALFYKIFQTYDTQNTGVLDSKTSVEIFRKSGLNRQDLEHIWNLADADNTGKLNKQEFTVGMHLVYRKINGHALPNVLPRSLVPQSIQIIDMMKDQLKLGNSASVVETKKATLTDGSAFKNNDELPSFRNRKNSKVEVDIEIQKQKQDEDQNQLEIETLKHLIRDKKIIIEAEISKNEDLVKERQLKDLDNLKQIEIIKSSVFSLPKPAGTSSTVLQSSYENLNARFISVLSNIDAVEEAIINSKIQSFKKQNPSSISGTGKNGEITENDMRKAKKRAALAERMALLTGKSLASNASIEKEESLLRDAIFKIKEESNKTKENVDFIKNDVNDLFVGIKSNLYGKAGNESDTKKFDLGIGLENEVKDFIKHLKTKENANNLPVFSQKKVESKSSSEDLQRSNTGAVLNSSSNAQSLLNNSGLSKEKNFSELNQNERAAYIKEQAQKKMNEKLDKLGLGRRNRRNRSSSKVNFSEKISSNKIAASEPVLPVQNIASETLPTLNRDALEEKPSSFLKPQTFEILERESQDEHFEPMKVPDTAESSTAAFVKNDQTVLEPITISNVEKVTNDDLTSPEQQIAQQQQHHKFNPFVTKPAAPVFEPKQPFFQQPTTKSSSQSSFDSKAAEEQRKMQRGLHSDSDGWSEDEIEKKLSDITPKPEIKSQPSFISSVPVAPKLQDFSQKSNAQFIPQQTQPLVKQHIATQKRPDYNDDNDGWSDDEDSKPEQLEVNASKTTSIPAVYSSPPVPIAPVIQSNVHSESAQPSLHNAPLLPADTVTPQLANDNDDDLSLPESISTDDDF